ncbi:MAG TPA: hypothetical protein VIB82_08165 [Caulobacteraceae bacterium]
MTFPDSRTCLNLIAVLGAVGIGAVLTFHAMPAPNAALLGNIVTGLFAVANLGARPSSPQTSQE